MVVVVGAVVVVVGTSVVVSSTAFAVEFVSGAAVVVVFVIFDLDNFPKSNFRGFLVVVVGLTTVVVSPLSGATVVVDFSVKSRRLAILLGSVVVSVLSEAATNRRV